MLQATNRPEAHGLLPDLLSRPRVQ